MIVICFIMFLDSQALGETIIYRLNYPTALFERIEDDESDEIIVLLIDEHNQEIGQFTMHSSVDDNFEPERNCNSRSRAFSISCTKGQLKQTPDGLYYPDKFVILSEGNIESILSDIVPLPLKSRWAYANRESAGGNLDFAVHDLRHKYYLIDGVIYNQMDTGNYLWGRAMRKLGFSRRSIFLGSQLFALFMTFKLDDPADQRAIFQGYQDQSEIE